MKRKSKAMAAALCLSLFAAMTMGGCSSVSSSADKTISGVEIKNSSAADEGKNDAEKESAGSADKNGAEANASEGNTEAATEAETTVDAANEEASISEQVIYDANDIKITATGLEDGWLGTELKLLIENNSSQGITVQARNANVNGFMVDTILSADVAAGKKVNDELTFSTSGLKDCGIEKIAAIEFSFHIINSETWDAIVDTDVISLQTSIASSYTQEVDDSGEVLADANGIKIIAKGLSANDSFWGPGVILYIENNSAQNVTIQVRDVSVNGFMVDSSMSEDVAAGKKAMSAVQFFSSDLEKNSITDITEVELYFHVFDQSSWDAVFDSDVVKISF